MPYWATLPVAAIVSRRWSASWSGFPALRLGGLYLALTTFALAVAVPQVLKVQGVRGSGPAACRASSIDKPDAPFGLPLNGDQWIYLFTLLVAT